MTAIAPSEERILDFAETMAYLKVSRPTLHRRIADGSINARKFGRKIYFKFSDVLEMGQPTATMTQS